MIFKLIIFALVSFILINCGAPGFEIIKSQKNLSNSSEIYVVVGKNNKLSSKSTQGGTHVDSKGVYLDPYIIKEKSSHNVIEAGFYITHHNYDLEGGFRPLREIVFLTEMNERIVSGVTGQSTDYDVSSWNAAGTESNPTFSEYGVCKLQLSNFINILTVMNLDVKIIGGNREQTYDKDEISESFISNLKEFYNTQLKQN